MAKMTLKRAMSIARKSWGDTVMVEYTPTAPTSGEKAAWRAVNGQPHPRSLQDVWRIKRLRSICGLAFWDILGYGDTWDAAVERATARESPLPTRRSSR